MYYLINYNLFFFFFFNDTATTEIYTTANTLSLHDALPIPDLHRGAVAESRQPETSRPVGLRSEEHTSELQSLAVISYAVFCLNKKKLSIPSTTVTCRTNHLSTKRSSRPK